MNIPLQRIWSLVLVAGITLVMNSTQCHGQHRGIQNKPAPELDLDQWGQLPDKSNGFKLADQKGKVVFLYCFQAHCPGCRASGFPRVKKLFAKYKDDPKVQFVAVQTTFGSDSFAQAKEVMTEFNLGKVPVAQDEAVNGLPKTSRAYQTGGTPWMAIIDKRGIVRANDFHIKVDVAGNLIDQLKVE